MSVKINNFMFMHDPGSVLNDIRQACLEEADKWMDENKNDLHNARKEYVKRLANIAVIYNPDVKHPFIIYLKENKLGHGTLYRYFIPYLDILPKDARYRSSLFIGIHHAICQTFEYKVIQYGIGTKHR